MEQISGVEKHNGGKRLSITTVKKLSPRPATTVDVISKKDFAIEAVKKSPPMSKVKIVCVVETKL